jgi:hypothetical protein
MSQVVKLKKNIESRASFKPFTCALCRIARFESFLEKMDRPIDE